MMKNQEMMLWLLDTIAEGGYSIREIYEYTSHHWYKFDDIYLELSNLIINLMMSIKAGICTDKHMLNTTEENGIIANDTLSDRFNSKAILELTYKGRSFLNDHGIGLLNPTTTLA